MILDIGKGAQTKTRHIRYILLFFVSSLPEKLADTNTVTELEIQNANCSMVTTNWEQIGTSQLRFFFASGAVIG